jgi:hypothetical protein
VVCGGGSDKVQADVRDDTAADCEEVAVPDPPPLLVGTIQVTRAGYLVARLTCPPRESSCSGTLSGKTIRRIGGRFISLGQAGFRLREDQMLAVKAKIPSANRRALKGARRVKIRVIATNVNSATGAKSTVTRTPTVVTRGL